MKNNNRLIGTTKTLSFKNWVTQHNPKLKWDWDSPDNLNQQLVDCIKVSGDLDIKTLFHIFFAEGESGLSFTRNDRFSKDNY